MEYQTKGMSLVALLKTHLSHFTDHSFTVFRWMKDEGWRMENTTTENDREPGKVCKIYIVLY